MLKKRTRSHQKDQEIMGQGQHLILDSNSDVFLKQKHKTNSFFTVPGLFVGLNPRNSEPDSIRSPTSPLDFKVFSKPIRNPPFSSTRPPTSNDPTQKSRDCNKVGLSIVEYLEDEMKPSLGKILQSSVSKSILFAPQMGILSNPSLKFDHFELSSNSLPKNYAVFSYTQIKKPNLEPNNPLEQELLVKFCSNSLDSSEASRTKLSSSSNGQNLQVDLVGLLSASEIELSEDYTCVRKHGPNPKTTHIFGDRILECHNDMFIAKSFKNEEHETVFSAVPTSYPLDDFLSFCFTCNKKLEGEDIYMYRGEKGFCSWNCRSHEILIDEEMEKTNSKEYSSLKLKPNSCEDLFETSMFMTTKSW